MNIGLCGRAFTAGLFVLSTGLCCRQNTPAISHDSRRIDVQVPVHPESRLPAAVAVYVRHYGIKMGPDGSLAANDDCLIVSIWRDGRIVWSEDSTDGGGPYYEGFLKTAEVEELVDRLWQLDLLSKSGVNRMMLGPDASCTVIAVAHGSRLEECASWHELFEQNPGLVATDRGIESLQGRTREQAIAASSRDYRQFRYEWNQARKIIAEYISESGALLDAFPVKTIRLRHHDEAEQ